MDMKLHTKYLQEELEKYYASFDPAKEQLLKGLKDVLAEDPEESSYAKKSRMHEYLCTACPVKLFRHTPFFFEMSSGRGRYTWGGLQSEVGSYMHNVTAPLWIQPYLNESQKDRQEGFLHGSENPVSFDHHVAGYDRILKLGINGIIAKAEEKLAACTNERKQDFYRSVIRSNRALLLLAQRFSEEAARLAAKASDEEEKAHYETIAAAAQQIPANPPRTFYEALNMIFFYRECVSSIEGIGISSFAQLDRMLYPYYEADLAAGRITPEKTKQLIRDLLVYTDIRFDFANAYHETSTTIELGGCDAEGNIIYNELTKMILQAVIEVRSVGTKINCRISKKHPREYLEKIMEVQLAKLPCVMMHNDDVLIPARVKQGYDIEDARLYVGCGCHEVTLTNTEVCTRADTWISMPRIVMESMRNHGDAASFEEFYRVFLKDAKSYYERIVTLKNKYEAYWCECDPLPLYSSSLTGPLKTGKDATEGGAKYSTTALSMVGTATMIDSLYSIKQLVFEEKRVTIPEFLDILEQNFNGQESLRQYIIRRIPKHGTNDATVDIFSAKVLEDISNIAGQANARGGKYLPAFYPHEIYRHLGQKLGATPDGRLAGFALSRGVSPSEFIETESPLNIIHSLRDIDFTRYADSFITEITLPQMENNEQNKQILTAIILAFLDVEGSSMQFNLIEQELLLAAKREPEKHKNLLVRVCGYSAAFVTLAEDVQDEIIRRAVR